jgi:hypothetical protein
VIGVNWTWGVKAIKTLTKTNRSSYPFLFILNVNTYR